MEHLRAMKCWRGKATRYNPPLSNRERCHSTDETVIISGGGIGISRRLKEQIKMKNAKVRV